MTAMLVLGGARSGKSRRALELAEAAGERRTYIATAEPLDREMAERIAQHQSARGEGWTTLEVPLDLAEAVMGQSGGGTVCLVDCLTIWLSNLMHQGRDPEGEGDRLCDAAAEYRGTIVLVSNEVGMGIVPESALGREFRDVQGRMNQKMAAVCDTVEFVAAGLPILLKGPQ